LKLKKAISNRIPGWKGPQGSSGPTFLCKTLHSNFTFRLKIAFGGPITSDLLPKRS